jgi:hypothetical protein
MSRPCGQGNRLIVSLTPTSAHLWRRLCGLAAAWVAVPEPMVEYFDPDFVIECSLFGNWYLGEESSFYLLQLK